VLAGREGGGRNLGVHAGALAAASAHAARAQDELAGHPTRIVGGKVRNDRCDVLHLSDPAERRQALVPGVEVGAHHAGGAGAIGFDQAGIDRVGADAARTELAREHAGDGIDRALGAAVDGAFGRMDAGDVGTDVDDAGALAQVRHGGAGDQQRSEDVDVELLAIERFAGVLDPGELVDAGVVHHDVQPPEAVDGRLDQRFDLGLVADVRRHGHGRAAGRFDVGDHLVRAVLVGGVIDHDLRAVGGETAGNAGADALGGTGHEGDFVFQLVHVWGPWWRWPGTGQLDDGRHVDPNRNVL